MKNQAVAARSYCWPSAHKQVVVYTTEPDSAYCVEERTSSTPNEKPCNFHPRLPQALTYWQYRRRPPLLPSIGVFYIAVFTMRAAQHWIQFFEGNPPRFTDNALFKFRLAFIA